MQTANVYLELLHERGRNGLPVERVYRQLFNPDLYLAAYGKIYRNTGATTPGVTDETVDGMSQAKIRTIIDALRYERYEWTPVRRTYIPKKNGKLRPLGLPSWSDKLLQEVIRQILEAYFEPQFSDHAHGFRPKRGCHTALRDIYYNWSGTTWFIEGDISQCFDRLDHDRLLSILSETIHDGRFIHLMHELLKAGYVENWKWHATLSGAPQGGIVSPILTNIYLSKLDKFVETDLIPHYTRGVRRRHNPVYGSLMGYARKLRQQGHTAAAQLVRRQAQQLPSYDPDDPDFRRLKYVRYADDILLGFIGPKSEAEEIKQRLGNFLHEELKLELSKTKSLLTHARTAAARFLGYEIHTLQCNTKQTHHKRSINGRIGLRVPRDVIEAHCQRYQRNGKAIHRRELEQDSDFTILAAYQTEYRGLVEYYRLAYNLHSLQALKGVMETSLTKTLAAKFQVSVSTIYNRYQATLLRDGTAYKGLQVIRPRDGKPSLVAEWGGIPLTWDIQANLNDQPLRIWKGQSELEKRLRADTCEYCGATEAIEVHHIRALKDLTRHTGREKPEWVKTMAARQRKTLVLCRTCHQDVTYGRPMRRQKSSS